jgi:hypothetical protein
MGLQNTTTRCMREIRRFLCKNIARMAFKTEQTREMHARCMRDARFIMIECCFLCNNISRMGLQTHNNEMHASNQTLSLSQYSKDGFTKQNNEMHASNQTLTKHEMH